MKIYIVYNCYHYDDYKRADSSSGIEKIFTDKEKAYDFANNKLLLMFEDYAKYSLNLKYIILTILLKLRRYNQYEKLLRNDEEI